MACSLWFWASLAQSEWSALNFSKMSLRVGFKLKKLEESTGSGMLEAAITVPVFILVVLMVVDITRYFVAYNVLNYAAFSAADLASKYEIETDTRAQNCPNDATANNPCAKYCRRVKAILSRANQIATSLSNKAPGVGPLNRLTINHYYESDQAFQPLIADCASTVLDSYGVGFIRPGERARTVEATPRILEVPTRPYGTEAGKGWPGNGESWISVLSAQPFQVVMEADIVPVMPLVGKIRMEIKQTAYRRGAGFAQSTINQPGGPGITYATGTPYQTPSIMPTAMPTCPACCADISCDAATTEQHCVQCYCAGGCGG